MHHPFVHIELSALDRHQAAEFYKQVFGWESQHHDEMSYTTFDSGTPNVGGGLNPVGNGMPAGAVVIYVHADDVDGTLARAEAAGATVVMPAYDLPSVGRMAVFKDPSGNFIGLARWDMPASAS